MTDPDPQHFYNATMPQKIGCEYEHARWHANPIVAAQYEMMTDALGRLVIQNVRGAKRILEVGPGPGTWTKLLLSGNESAEYALVDISREMLSQARKNLADRPNISFVESDLLSYEPPQRYDFFFSSRAIEYMPDKRKICERISELLLPGGFGAVVTKMPKPFFDKMRGRAVSDLHSAQIRPAALVRLLEEHGLRAERVEIATATVPLFESALLNKIAYRSLKHLFFPPLFFLAESYIVTFRKMT